MAAQGVDPDCQVDLDDRPALNCLQRPEPRFCLTILVVSRNRGKEMLRGTEAR